MPDGVEWQTSSRSIKGDRDQRRRTGGIWEKRRRMRRGATKRLPQHNAKDSTKVRINLDLDGALDGLSLLLLSGDCLGTHDATAPVTTALLVFGGVTVVDGGDEFAELGLVLALDLGECDHGGGLLVHDRT